MMMVANAKGSGSGSGDGFQAAVSKGSHYCHGDSYHGHKLKESPSRVSHTSITCTDR